jgi:transposase
MADDLHVPGKLGADIVTAWNAKEDLLDVLPLAHTKPERREVSRRLHQFYSRCAASGLPELERLAATVETCWPEIGAFPNIGVTIAGSEGTNRVIKTIARDAYGFRNPETNGYAPATPPPDAPVAVSADNSRSGPAPSRRGLVATAALT